MADLDDPEELAVLLVRYWCSRRVTVALVWSLGPSLHFLAASVTQRHAVARHRYACGLYVIKDYLCLPAALGAVEAAVPASGP